MAPSIAEAPKADIVVPVKPDTVETEPRIRRAIDEEGGTTTASVRALLHPDPVLSNMTI